MRIAVAAVVLVVLGGCGYAKAKEERIASNLTYASSIDLSRVTIRREGEKFVLSGEIQNSGNRTVANMQLTAYLLDAQGHRMHEQLFFPISNVGLRRTDPLRPGYRRALEGEDAESVASGVPNGWSGRAELRVTGLRFDTD